MADNEKIPGEAPSSAPSSKGGDDTPPPVKDITTEPPVHSREGPAPTDAPGAKKVRNFDFLSGLLVAAIIVVVGLGTAFFYRAALVNLMVPEAGEEDGRIAALEAKLAALEEADRRSAEAAASLAVDLANRQSEIAALSNTLGRFEDEGGETITSDLEIAKTMIAALEERLNTFETETGERDPMTAGADTNPGKLAQSAGSVNEMKDALAALNDRFAAMNESLEAAGGRIEALEEVAPPANLDDILQNLSPRNELGDLAARLAAIEDADPEGAARAAVLALSATELARAAATSQPFVSELEAFTVLAPQNTFTAQLEPFAAQGVMTHKTLVLEFEEAARSITDASRLREGGGFWNWIVNKVTSLFSIRKVGERDGDDWQSVLARAENRIAIEDLAAAAEELAKLEGAAAKGAAPWLTRVRARQQVDTLVTGLTAGVFAELLTALESE